MKTARMMTLSAMLCAGSAMPTLAAWDHVGTIRIDQRRGPNVKTFDFGGPVAGLRLRAEERDIRCNSVRATFANGTASTIYRGRLRQGRDTAVDLPRRNRSIANLAFDCDTRGHRGARIEISADIGQYRSDWMRGPNWQRSWSKVFNWGSNAIYDWKYLGQERFEGKHPAWAAENAILAQ